MNKNKLLRNAIPLSDNSPDTIETPERNLLAACLERAIRDILNPPQSEGGSKLKPGNQLCREACAWLRSHRKDMFSFSWICHQLDISPVIVRRWVYEMQKKGERYDFGEQLKRGPKPKPLKFTCL